MTRKAVISGASIAGPVLAFWLAEAGWHVTVVERADQLRTSGYPVDVRGAAVDVVTRMGLHEQLVEHRYRHVPVALLSPRGHRLCTLDYGNLLGSSGEGDVEISRAELSAVLFQASADRVEYVFSESITALRELDSGIEVTFERRPAEIVDVVIGADGIHSNVRALAFGPEDRYLRHLGPYVAVWDLPDDAFAPGAGFFYSHPGRTVLVERPFDGAPGRAFATFVHPAPGTIDRRDSAAVADAFRTAFAEDRWRTAEVLDTMSDSGDVYVDTVSQVRMPRWSEGRVALVGDAAYAPAFLSGQGTSIAIAGAYVLARELCAHERPQDAFIAYERRLRDYVTKNQDLALRTDGTVLARTPGQLLRRNAKLCAVPLLQRLGLIGLLQKPLRSAATSLELTDDDLGRPSEILQRSAGR
ncbi:oxidoreductase [Mycolicibacterium sp. 018/SC-01/001]|uniref:FAD-dependent monooxygenase n=1 Tax=Mycolicibacterium sp. 018/SC-01/001 TaxID=2592069 RepID=UPI00117C1D89|nr:FAD-dependent monooxygenase [Mycolicibacterium sp. 018/SC-01/001]TRW79024.1 oxidoreductase [Mycolicibacterium sp. 018/SC-01/001]